MFAYPHPWHLSICVDDRSIGFIFIFQGSGNDRCRVDIGYGLATKHWGQGITTKVVKIAFSQVFKDLPNFVRLQATIDVENEESQSVLEKAGSRRRGY
jgi:RimJ/RimL family protein N-acetyltransferase